MVDESRYERSVRRSSRIFLDTKPNRSKELRATSLKLQVLSPTPAFTCGGALRRPLKAAVRLRLRPPSRHTEGGESQAPPDGEQPERNDHNHTRRKRARAGQPKRLQEQVKDDSHDCGSRVDISPQDQGHLRCDDIP